MGDMSFNVASVPVQAGETVRFVLRNTSAAPHDFTVGTPEMQRIRRGFLKRMITSKVQAISPAERHKLESWNAVVVLPGETRELVWTFNKTQDVEFGSNISGHYEAGMKGRFRIASVVEDASEQPPVDRSANDDAGSATVREGQEGLKTAHPSLQHHVRLSAKRQRVQSIRQRRKTSKANRRPSKAAKPLSKAKRRQVIVRTNYNGGTNGGTDVEAETVGAIDKGARGTGQRASVRAAGEAIGNGGEPNSSGSSGAGAW